MKPATLTRPHARGFLEKVEPFTSPPAPSPVKHGEGERRVSKSPLQSNWRGDLGVRFITQWTFSKTLRARNALSLLLSVVNPLFKEYIPCFDF
jgi:hypothetical protein